MSKSVCKAVVLTLVLSAVLTVPVFALESAGVAEDFAPAPQAVPLAPSAAVTVTILHTNDVHGHVDEYNRDHSACNPASATDCIGGAARLATQIEEIRGANPNVLLVDAGDQFQGTLYYSLFKADIVTVTMNALGYDAMAVGNHEFDDGPDELARLIDGADFPVLSANIDASASAALSGKIAASTVVTRGGERFGIVGLTTPETENISSPGSDVVFNDPATSLQAAVNALTAQGVDKIIALTHLGYDEDLALAQVITGVDVIVGGHSHTFVYTPTDPISFSPPQYPKYDPLQPAGPYPTKVSDLDGNPVLVVSDYQWGTFLGKLDVAFDANGLVSSYSGNPIYMANTVTQSATIVDIITPTYKVPVQAIMNTAIGTTTVDLPLTVGGNRICRVRECLLGDLVADALLWKINSIDPSDQYQIAFQNGGGLRTSIVSGSVSIGNVIEVLPFGNAIATFEMTGTKIIEALENGVSRYPAYDGRFPQVAGLRYYWTPSLAPGSRIISVQVFDGSEYVPLDPDAVYKVASNDFMRQGGDGYTVFRDFAIDPYDYGPALDEALKEYFETFSPVTPEIEGRITMLDKVVTILHTNDIHGRFPSELYYGTPEGMTYLASHIKAERAKNPNALLIDAGDTFQGNAFAQYFRNDVPNPIAGGMNLLDYDAMVIGNHEYNFGPTTFATMLGQLNFPILGSANVDDDGTYGFINDHVEDYITMTVDGLDVAIFGLTNPEVPLYELPSNIEGLTFYEAVTTAKTLVPQIEAAEMPDVMIALNHIGYDVYKGSYDKDETMAEQVPGIDVIVGAHSHTKIDPAVMITSTVNPTGTLVAQTGAYAQYLGKVNIGFTGNVTDGYEIVLREGYLLEAKETVEDTEMVDYLEPFVISLTHYTEQVIGYTTEVIDALEAYTEETNGANLQADAAVFALEQNGIDVDFHLSGAMSNRRVPPAGTLGTLLYPLTVGDMYTLMPYENSLLAMRMNGPQLKAVLERAYRNYYYYKYVPGYGGYSHYTTCMLDINEGGVITYTDAYPVLPDGHNVQSLVVNGQSVDFMDATTYYTVSTVNYLAAGSCNFNDAGVTLWPLNQIVADTQIYVRDSVIDYIVDQGTISPMIEGRLVFLPVRYAYLPLVMKSSTGTLIP